MNFVRKVVGHQAYAFASNRYLARGFAAPKGKEAPAGVKEPPKDEKREAQLAENRAKLSDDPYNFQNLSKKQQNWEMYMHRYNAIARSINDQFAKKLEETSLMPKNKIVVPIVRLRKKEDTIELLKNSGLCACYLKLYNEEQRDHQLVHFVLEQKQLFAIRRLKDRDLRHIYLVIDNKEYRCMVESIKQQPSNPILISVGMARKRCIQRVRGRKAKLCKNTTTFEIFKRPFCPQ